VYPLCQKNVVKLFFLRLLCAIQILKGTIMRNSAVYLHLHPVAGEKSYETYNICYNYILGMTLYWCSVCKLTVKQTLFRHHLSNGIWKSILLKNILVCTSYVWFILTKLVHLFPLSTMQLIIQILTKFLNSSVRKTPNPNLQTKQQFSRLNDTHVD